MENDIQFKEVDDSDELHVAKKDSVISSFVQSITDANQVFPSHTLMKSQSPSRTPSHQNSQPFSLHQMVASNNLVANVQNHKQRNSLTSVFKK